MITPLDSAVCLTCGGPVNVIGDCMTCLLRAGLDRIILQPSADAAFGDFEVKRRADGSPLELGHGAMGITYLATDNVLRRSVALKVIEVPEAARGSRAVRERFLREARAAAALRHPNVAAVYQFGTIPDGSRCYCAMELVEGETLEARVRRDGPLHSKAVLEIAIQVTRALVAAAAHGLIHRDLKPGNIMLTAASAGPAELEVKVIDFGLAKAVARAGEEMDLTHGAFVGTPNFASPEQFQSGAVDVRADIYSLGATLWFALTGLAPRLGNTIKEIREGQIRDDLPVKRLVARKVPQPLVKLLRSVLAVDPGKRPASARELMDALESCRRKLIHRPFYKLTAFIALVAIAVATLVLLRLNGQKTASDAARNAAPSTSALLPAKSIAVLPLENLSDEKENAFFAAGIQDDLLSDLSKIKDLKVISRTSVMQYKSGLARNLKEIARQLGVRNVVEGSVRRSRDRVRVSVQLIDARTDTHLWAEHYDRDLADVFAIQAEIAQQIADQLRSKLSPAEKAAIAERPTADPAAFALYTEAKAIGDQEDWQGTEKSLNREVELLEKATQRDPNFALAYCALAKTQIGLSAVTNETGNYHIELAKKAAEAALRVRPDLGEAHLELARYYFFAGVKTNSYDRAREELTIARRTLPNNSDALIIEARIGRHENRWDASLADLQKASELDPRNGDVTFYLWQISFEMRRYSDCDQLIRKSAESGTLDLSDENFLAMTKLAQGDPVAAQSLLEQVPLDYSPGFWIWNTRFTAALYVRDYEAANRVIAATPAKWADFAFDQLSSGWADGQVARARGDKQKALAAFATARKKVEATWGDKPKDASDWADVARLDAGLGRQEEAIREALRAVELRPIAMDSLNGPLNVAGLALVYAWMGERDRALEQLEIVATIPAGPTYGDLRFNPCWDNLRGDKRFDKIVAEAKAAMK